MQELMSRHKAYALSPRDCLKTTLFQKWQKMVAPPGELLILNTFLTLLCLSLKNSLLTIALYTNIIYTHELINLHISAMAYYINTLDGERSVHGRCEPKCFKDGDLF